MEETAPAGSAENVLKPDTQQDPDPHPRIEAAASVGSAEMV